MKRATILLFVALFLVQFTSYVYAENCSQTANRTDLMYCSTSHQLVPQKNFSERCSNNYECRSNECVVGLCSRDNTSDSNATAYWIFGAVGLIVLLLIVLVLIRRPTSY